MRSKTSREQHLEYRRGRKQATKPATGSTRPAKPRSRSFGALLAGFVRLANGEKQRVAWALALLTAAALLKITVPVATKFAIDYALIGEPLPPVLSKWVSPSLDRFTILIGVTLAATVASLMSLTLHLVSRWRATQVAQRLQAKVRRKAFEQTLRLPLDRIYQLKSGGGPNLIRFDAGGVGELIFGMLYNPWQAVIQLVGVVLILLWVDWRLGLLGMLLTPVIYLKYRVSIAHLRPLYRDIRDRRQEIDTLITEVLSGIRIVRGFARQRDVTDRFVKANHLLVRQQVVAWLRARTVDLFWGIAIPLASLTLFLYGGSRVLRGELSVGDLTMLLVYLTMLLNPMATITNSIASFQDLLSGLDRVLDLFEQSPAVDTLPVGKRIDAAATKGDLTLRGVSFQYPGRTEFALREVDLDIHAGETIALVGRSGAGKTTLSNLVARFYDPTEGVVTLDGVDLRDLRCDDYRRMLAIVEQDVFLFDGTIADNIGYSRRDASPADIKRSAELAEADQFISNFEQGYDTIVGERGVRLSGGQRQRVAIARAVLADPRVLILDEATSNIDTQSERLIQSALAKLMKGRTTLVIAHRMSSLVYADRIAALDNGRIVECGTHNELMGHRGLYRTIVELQKDDQLPT